MIDLIDLDVLYDEYRYSNSYHQRVMAKVKLMQILSESSRPEALCYSKMVENNPFLSADIFMYIWQLKDDKYVSEFKKYYTSNNEDYMDIAYESLGGTFWKDPATFELTCEMIASSNRSQMSNICCAQMFKKLALKESNYRDLLGPMGTRLRNELRALLLPYIGLDPAW